MKLLIDLDEEYIKAIDKIKFLVGGRADRRLEFEVIKAIKNGTPLPKGHGDLKAEIDKLPRIKVGNSNSPTLKYCIDEVLLYDLLENYNAEKTAEWIKIREGIKVTEYKCSACGRAVVMIQTIML